MIKFYQIMRKEGNVYDARSMEKVANSCEKLFDGTYLVSFMRLRPISEIKEYRACYFAKIDVLAAEVGDTRYAVHELVKDNILEEMINFTPELFTTPEITTKYLTPEGWIVLLDRLDLWAFTNYNIILP